MIRLICGVTAAMVGAGFASGREIMQFFSRFGPWSWLLIAVSSLATGWLTERMMGVSSADCFFPEGKRRKTGKAALLLLFLCTAGAMTAAAGELAALTMPIHHARSFGAATTLLLCCQLSHRSMDALKRLGIVLVPLMAAAWGMCIGMPADTVKQGPFQTGGLLPGFMFSVFYSAMNVMLSSGALCDAGAGCTRQARRRTAVGVGCVTAALLSLGNLALLPRGGAMLREQLPTVILLRHYGKTGFYLAAGLLYLAVFTTLIAVLRSMEGIWPKRFGRYRNAGILLSVFSASLLGFDEIVALLYPIAGALSLVMMLRPRKKSAEQNACA